MRDDFPNYVKDLLAKRAGYYCSFPGCGTLTIGSSAETTSSTSSIGTAAHILAASSGPGARRHNPNKTSQERSSYENGIWMCSTHGKLIDTDERRFTVELLNLWRKQAEEISNLMIQNKLDYQTADKIIRKRRVFNNDVQFKVPFSPGSENQIIGEALIDSGLGYVWGIDVLHPVKEFIIEYLRNAFIHGGAKQFRMEVTNGLVVLMDDGKHYNPKDLVSKKGLTGGIVSAKSIFNDLDKKLFVSTTYCSNSNQTVIGLLKKKEDLMSIKPCVIEIDSLQIHTGDIKINFVNSCESKYVLLPAHFALSDMFRMPQRFPAFREIEEDLVFVIQDVSNNILSALQENYPKSRIIVL